MWVGALHVERTDHLPVSLVEVGTFSSDIDDLLSPPEQARLKMCLAANPEQGVLIPGAGGVRKLRWALEGTGKSGGARVIYYYHNHTVPIFLLAIYPKSEKIDISKSQLWQIKLLVKKLVREYSER